MYSYWWLRIKPNGKKLAFFRKLWRVNQTIDCDFFFSRLCTQSSDWYCAGIRLLKAIRRVDPLFDSWHMKLSAGCIVVLTIVSISTTKQSNPLISKINEKSNICMPVNLSFSDRSWCCRHIPLLTHREERSVQIKVCAKIVTKKQISSKYMHSSVVVVFFPLDSIIWITFSHFVNLLLHITFSCVTHSPQMFCSYSFNQNDHNWS